ncbi:hypothetical protein Tco_1017178 [Tanacetum coccineum]|uniref:Uncharacterized protein n=1 Tax=Tanacetum coccineum TaxID=301880 RepID=A0ABQ5FQS5_9ASTR
MYRPSSELSRQEEFEHIVMNVIFDQEERIRQLEDYMQVITDEFLEFSLEVARRLKEMIKEKNEPRKIKKITKYLDIKVLENGAKHDFLESLEKKTFPTLANLLCVRYVRLIHSNPSQPQKNILGFKPGERANLSRHNPSNSLTVQPPTQNDTTFMVNNPIKHDPSPYCSLTHVESNRVFDPGEKTYDLPFKGSLKLIKPITIPISPSHNHKQPAATLINLKLNSRYTMIVHPQSAMSKRARSTKGQASSSREETMEEKVRKFGLFDNGNHQMNYNNLVGRSIHPGDVVDWEFLSNKGLAQPFFNFINTDTFSGPQWVNLFQINEPIFRELVREFFASFEFDASPCKYEPLHKDVTLRFNVGNTKSKSIRNPRIKLAYRFITMTITGRKETTNHVTEIDLFYLYCIFGEGFVCNIPYWLAKYLKSVRNKSVIFGGMFVTRIAWSFGLLTNEMVSVLNRDPPLHIYRKTSLVKMGVIMELHKGECCWPATREVAEEGEGDDEEGNGEGETKELGAPRTSTAT